MTRVLVVGAGSNGLVAAANLVRAGLDAEVLEHAPRPGGASSSTAAALRGFVYDHCAGFVPMAVVSPAMRELDLRLDWVNPPTVMAHPFADGTAIALERDLEATVASLGAAGRGWHDLIRRTAPPSPKREKGARRVALSPLGEGGRRPGEGTLGRNWISPDFSNNSALTSH